MNVEQTLTDDLRVVATAVHAPPPPTAEALVRRAEQERTRIRATRVAVVVLAAAAVVGAVVIGSQIGRPTAVPPPTEPSPSYYADGVPYVLKGTLYVDHEPQPGSWLGATTAGEYTAALRPTEPTNTMVILRDGVVVGSVPLVFHGPAFSPDGSKLAWIESIGDGTTGDVVVRDMAEFRDLGRLPVRLGEKGSTRFSISIKVDDDGTTHYKINGLGWSWKPGTTPTRTRFPAQEEVVNPAGFTGVDAWVRLSPDHLWGAWLTDRVGNELVGDAMGTGVTVQKPGDPDSRFTIPLPAGREEVFLSWESPTRLSFAAPGVSCDVVERWCKDFTQTDAP